MTILHYSRIRYASGSAPANRSHRERVIAEQGGGGGGRPTKADSPPPFLLVVVDCCCRITEDVSALSHSDQPSRVFNSAKRSVKSAARLAGPCAIAHGRNVRPQSIDCMTVIRRVQCSFWSVTASSACSPSPPLFPPPPLPLHMTLALTRSVQNSSAPARSSCSLSPGV